MYHLDYVFILFPSLSEFSIIGNFSLLSIWCNSCNSYIEVILSSFLHNSGFAFQWLFLWYHGLLHKWICVDIAIVSVNFINLLDFVDRAYEDVLMQENFKGLKNDEGDDLCDILS